MADIRAYIEPTYTRTDKADGGIRRVSEAQIRYLPEFGVEPVRSPDGADVIFNHGASLTERPGVPTVAGCHGLYWQRYEWDAWAHEVNKRVVETMAHAVAVTAPSQWVADAITRGMLLWPEVVYHGVDADEWLPAREAGQYVLWNKARTDPVSDPRDMQEVAKRMPGTQFRTTFGTASPNVQVVGRMTVQEMHAVVQGAGVYLATARETFGIGTLEALASGVPVAGWDYGGQHEIVVPGETGYLAPYGDYRALAECINRCLAERPRLSAAARADAMARWTWRPRIEQYAEILRRVVAHWRRPCPRVSVIVTCYNLARYLPDALESVLSQTMPDWECIVVDDGSTDDTPIVAQDYAERDPRIRYERTPANLKLPMALNYGIQRSSGRYVLPLDADNILDPRALEVLADALDADHGIHIAYGHLDLMDERGRNRSRNPGWPPAEFNWRAQMGHMNHIASSALVRREVYERTGGYRQRMWRAEDAEFWCRATSFGFRAKKVTELSVFFYRQRPDSKSRGEAGDGNWCAWFPWAYAATAQDGAKAYRDGKGPRLDLVPWGAQAMPPEQMRFWEVPDHTEPVVSVIIPVGPGHKRYLLDALDSLIAQTYQEWEAIVVFDDGHMPERIAGAPWARIYETQRPRSGPGVARNVGAKHARGRLLYFLDADDYLLPQTLDKMVSAWRETLDDERQYEGDIIYGGWLRSDGDLSGLKTYGADAFECGGVVLSPQTGKVDWEPVQVPGGKTHRVPAYRGVLRQMQHSVNVIVPRAYHERIGGFDEAMSGWEDWDYFIAMQAVCGACSTRLDEPLFVYAFRSGGRRESSFGDGATLKRYIREKWADYYTGRKQIMCGCNKKNVAAASAQIAAAQHAVTTRGTVATVAVAGQMAEAVKLRYQGLVAGPLMIRGPVSGTLYKFGHDASHREKWVRREDAPELMARSTKGVPHFTLAGAPPEPATPVPAAAAEDVTQQAIAPEPVRQEWDVMSEADDAPPAAGAADAPAPAEPEDDARPAMALPASILKVPVTEAKELIVAADEHTLLAWLRQERMAEKPRKTIVSASYRQLSRIPQGAVPVEAGA